jgi:hypothetical protein
VYTYGEDDRNFPTGVNHIINHTVPQAHPLTETPVGPNIKDVGSAPGVWHGEAPTVSTSTVEDEWTRRQKEATMVAGTGVEPGTHEKPVPVFIVEQYTGNDTLASWNGVNMSVVDLTLLCGRDYKRTRVLITNEDATNAIRIGRGNVTAAFGALVAPGVTRELFVQDKVYAISAVLGTPVKVSVIEEYGIDGGPL